MAKRKNRTAYYKFGHGNWLPKNEAFARAHVDNVKDLFEKSKSVNNAYSN